MSTAPDPGSIPPAYATVRIVMPHQLRTLAGISGEASVEVVPPVTLRSTIDALEARFPPLTGTVRHRGSGQRRAMIRIYAAGEDYTDAAPDAHLPDAVARGHEPLRLVGAIAGG